jgi:hypothetical protein
MTAFGHAVTSWRINVLQCAFTLLWGMRIAPAAQLRILSIEMKTAGHGARPFSFP